MFVHFLWFWSIFSVVFYSQEEIELFWNHGSAGSEISSLYLRLWVLKQVSLMAPAPNWVYFNNKHKRWRTGDNKNKQSTSWSWHLIKNLQELARFCQPLRDCRWEKGSLIPTYLPTNGARSWRMFFDSAGLPASIYFRCKSGPSILVIWKNSWKIFLSRTIDTQHVNRFLPSWMSPLSTFLLLKVTQNCFSLFSTFTLLFKSRKYHNIYQVTSPLFKFFFKISLKYLLVKNQR